MSIITRLKEKRLKHTNIVEFWKKRGVKFSGKGTGIEIYPSVDFGSEPYLVEIGDNVRLNKGVSIITHDGGGVGTQEFERRVS